MSQPAPADLKEAIARTPLAWWKSQRWFGGKGRDLQSSSVADWGEIPLALPAIAAIAAVQYRSGPEERYFLPLVAVPESDLCEEGTAPAHRLGIAGEAWKICDAVAFEPFRRMLLERLAAGADLKLSSGAILFRAEEGLGRPPPPTEPSKLLRGEQSNSSMVFGESLFLKCYRRVLAGVNPDFEVSRFLSREAKFRHSPRVLGSIIYLDASGTRHALGLLQSFVPSRGSGWEVVLEEVRAFLNLALKSDAEPSMRGVQALAPGQRVQMRRLGEVTGELHRALASSRRNPDFAPQPLEASVVNGWHASICQAARAVGRELSSRMGGFPAEQQSLARHVLSSWPMLERRAGSLLALGKEGVVAIRIHGDYHLGQLLVSHGRGFQIIDFEGEPVRSLEERRARGTPLRDVAGMLRSLAYVARSARRARDPACVDAALEAWAEVWEGSAREAFLAGYLDTVRGEPFLPRDPGVVRSALVALEIEKALLEIRYELDHRPDWLAIPLEGLGRMLSA